MAKEKGIGANIEIPNKNFKDEDLRPLDPLLRKMKYLEALKLINNQKYKNYVPDSLTEKEKEELEITRNSYNEILRTYLDNYFEEDRQQVKNFLRKGIIDA